MFEKQGGVIFMALVFFLFASSSVQAGGSKDFSDKLSKINASGFALVAKIDGKNEVVDNAREFEFLISGGKQPSFYLLHKKTGEKFEVEMEYGTKKHPGEYVWEFYQWVVSWFED